MSFSLFLSILTCHPPWILLYGYLKTIPLAVGHIFLRKWKACVIYSPKAVPSPILVLETRDTFEGVTGIRRGSGRKTWVCQGFLLLLSEASAIITSYPLPSRKSSCSSGYCAPCPLGLPEGWILGMLLTHAFSCAHLHSFKGPVLLHLVSCEIV